MPEDPHKEELELRKLALDERRFDFEVQKYNDEKAKRDLDRQKTDEEVRELKKPWWKKAAYLTPVATISVAVVGGILAFGTNALKSNLARLIKERQTLSATNAALNSKNLALSAKIADAQSQMAILQKQKEALAAKLPLDRFVALMAVLEQKTVSAPLRLDDPAFTDAYQAATAFEARSQITGLIEKERADPKCPATLKAGLTLILYKVSNEHKYKESLEADSIRSFGQAVRKGRIRDRQTVEPYVTILMDQTIFSLDERVEHLKTMYSNIDVSGWMSTIDPTLLHVLSDANEEAVARFREPWVEYLWFSQMAIDWNTWSDMNSPLTVPPLDRPSIAVFSPQGFALRLINLVTTDAIHGSADIDAAPGIVESPKSCPFPQIIPLCRDFFVDHNARQINDRQGSMMQRSVFIVSADGVDRAAKWRASNPQLSELFAVPYSMAMVATRMRRFNALPDTVFRKLIRREWITETEVVGGH